jgi:hypothetical protein
MTDYRLQVVFEPFERNAWSRRYRFAVIDPNKTKGYPANFVCVLPKRIYESGKPVTEFSRLFGKKGSEFAIELLEEALKRECDEKIKTELKKRLSLLMLATPKFICSSCHKEFEKYSRIRYRRTLCRKCLESRLCLHQN